MTDDRLVTQSERWPRYEEQSWSERFAELDRRYKQAQDQLLTLATEQGRLTHSPASDVGDSELAGKLSRMSCVMIEVCEPHPNNPSRVIIPIERTKLIDALRSQPASGDAELPTYDAIYLNDFGGGDVEWWHDYIRAELGRAHEFYQSHFAALTPTTLASADDGLFEAIKHGDDGHKAWLKEAIRCYFAGKPIPVVAGKGNSEAVRERTLEEAAKIADGAAAADAELSAQYRQSAETADCTSGRDVDLEYSVSFARRANGSKAIAAAIRNLKPKPEQEAG